MQQMEVRHYLSFEFAGKDEKFVFVVTDEEKEGVIHELLHKDREVDGAVVEFEDVSGRKVAVNVDYVRRCQALYDAGMFPQTYEDKPDMMILVEGMGRPLTYNDIDEDMAAFVASIVAGVGLGTTGFFSFTDEDGEDNLIPVEKVMLLESIHYEDEFDEEVSEEIEIKKPTKKPKSTRARKPIQDRAT